METLELSIAYRNSSTSLSSGQAGGLLHNQTKFFNPSGLQAGTALLRLCSSLYPTAGLLDPI